MSPYYPKTDRARVAEDSRDSHHRRPWDYWRRQQEENLRRALGEDLWRWLDDHKDQAK